MLQFEKSFKMPYQPLCPWRIPAHFTESGAVSDLNLYKSISTNFHFQVELKGIVGYIGNEFLQQPLKQLWLSQQKIQRQA